MSGPCQLSPAITTVVSMTRAPEDSTASDHTGTSDSGEQGSYVMSGQEFVRDTEYIETRITADGRDGYPVEAGRYRLVAARACPWANRTLIVRRLLGLEDAISLGLCGPTHDKNSWTFDLDPGGLDPVLQIPRLKDAYEKRFPGYPKGITVPAIVDVPTGEVVTNDFPQITIDFSLEWTAFHRDGAPELYPEHLRDEIDEVSRGVYTEVNNGVYRCGFAGSPGVLRRRLRSPVHQARRALRAAVDAAIPGRRHHHRGRRPPVHHPGPLRPRLPRPLQVQSQQAQRDAGAVGVRA